MEIYYFNSLLSTQEYLLDAIRSRRLIPPVAIVAKSQSEGRGSRGNHWVSDAGNLYFSFAFPLTKLPDDLPLASASIYFSYLLKEELKSAGSNVWVKWPNDFYIEEKKIGGTITSKVENTLICGIGINLNSAPEGFDKLDIEVEQETLFNSYFSTLNNAPSWKKVFSKYEIEFAKSMNFFVHLNGENRLLSEARLLPDGAVMIDGERVSSNR